MRNTSFFSSIILGGFQVYAKIKLLFFRLTLMKNLSQSDTISVGFEIQDTSSDGWQALKKATLSAASKNDSTTYCTLLYDFDSQLKLLEANKATFIGKGVGDTSLNSYRKLSTGNQTLFEKIYLKNTDDLSKLNWFYQHLHPQLKTIDIYTPALIKTNCGHLTCALYFEFLSAKLDNYPSFLSRAIEVSLKLSQLRVSEQHSSPNFHDFRQHAFYQASKRIAQKWLSEQGKNNFNFDNYEQKLAALPKWPAHGDLHGKNLGKPNIVIDWDNCGLYPLGFDIAVSMSKSLHIANIAHLRYFLNHKIKPFIDKKEWPAFEQSIYFFLFVFYAGRIGRKITFKTWQALASNAKQ